MGVPLPLTLHPAETNRGEDETGEDGAQKAKRAIKRNSDDPAEVRGNLWVVKDQSLKRRVFFPPSILSLREEMPNAQTDTPISSCGFRLQLKNTEGE